MFSSIAPNKAMSLFLALLVFSVLECHSADNTSDNRESSVREMLYLLCSCCLAKETSVDRAVDTGGSYKSSKASASQYELDHVTVPNENLNQVDNEKS